MTTALVLPFPMRGGKYLAQIVVPIDLSKEEAARITAMLKTLPIPKKQPRDSRGRFAKHG